MESRALELLAEHLASQAANVERAERLATKAARLEEAGTPSESARNRADRARREVAASIDALRTRFVRATREVSGSAESYRAFDRALQALRPAFVPPNDR